MLGLPADIKAICEAVCLPPPALCFNDSCVFVCMCKDTVIRHGDKDLVLHLVWVGTCPWMEALSSKVCLPRFRHTCVHGSEQCGLNKADRFDQS